MSEDKKASSHYVNNQQLYDALVEWKKQTALAVAAKLQKPPVPDFVAECMMKMATRLSQKAGFVNYCVDEQTEALSQRGWLKYNELTMNDILLCCDPKDLQLKWTKVLGVFINKKYDGNMFHLTGNGLDALVTPEHKFLTVEHGPTKVEYLKQLDHIVLMGKAVSDPPVKTYSDAFVKLVGWAGSYRLGKHTHSVVISQKKEQGIKNIVDCLTETGATWSTYIFKKDVWRDFSYETDDGRILTARYSKKGMHYFSVTGAIANQIISVSPKRVLSNEFILALTQEQRLMLIQTMINGDGYLARFYNQKDKKHLDAFTSLCIQAGIRITERQFITESAFGKCPMWRVTLCEGENTKWGTKVIGCKVENIDFHGSQRDLTHADHFRGELHKGSKLTVEKVLEARALNAAGISFRKLAPKYGVNQGTLHRAVTGGSWKHANGYDSIIKKEHQASTPYKGVVWCPQTEHGSFVCRRNGKTYVTQNSYRDDMIADSLESNLRYIHNFDPEKSNNPFAYITQIIHNAFIRRILKERKQLYIKMKIIDQSDFIDSYERQDSDGSHYNNNYVTYLQENKGDVIAQFESWKEGKKNKANAKKAAANLEQLFEAEVTIDAPISPEELEKL